MIWSFLNFQQVKQRLDDIGRRLEVLFDKIRAGQVSKASYFRLYIVIKHNIQELHSLVFIKSRHFVKEMMNPLDRGAALPACSPKSGPDQAQTHTHVTVSISLDVFCFFDIF